MANRKSLHRSAHALQGRPWPVYKNLATDLADTHDMPVDKYISVTHLASTLWQRMHLGDTRHPQKPAQLKPAPLTLANIP